MKTRDETKKLNKMLLELTDDALLQVTGGHGEPGTLDRILIELSSWLDAHPNATKSDIYDILHEKKDENADILTADEVIALNELLNSFAS